MNKLSAAPLLRPLARYLFMLFSGRDVDMRFFRFVRHHRLQSVLVLLTCLALLTAGCGSSSGSAPGNGKAGSPDTGTVSGSESKNPSDADESTAGSKDDDKTAGSKSDDKAESSKSDDKAESSSDSKNSEDLEAAPAGGSNSSAGKDSGAQSNVSEEKAGKSADTGLTSGPAAGAAVGSTDAQTAEEPRKLKYIDAWNEWHVMDVDPTVTENIYDPGKWTENDGLTTLEDDRYEVLQGVDVSEHQGYIDWNKVAEAGFRFAFIRIGYRGYGEAGNLYEDATAVDNLRAAKAAGLQVGTYIFSQALNEKEAREEGALAVRVITEAGVETDLPVMYDPELIKDDWGRANEITREQVSLNTAAFKDQVENTSDLKVDIYSNLPWEHNYFDAATMNQYQIWYADYEKLPQTPYHFVWWQYTNEGHVPGIEGRVDLNLWVREKKTAE